MDEAVFNVVIDSLECSKGTVKQNSERARKAFPRKLRQCRKAQCTELVFQQKEHNCRSFRHNSYSENSVTKKAQKIDKANERILRRGERNCFGWFQKRREFKGLFVSYLHKMPLVCVGHEKKQLATHQRSYRKNSCGILKPTSLWMIVTRFQITPQAAMKSINWKATLHNQPDMILAL